MCINPTPFGPKYRYVGSFDFDIEDLVKREIPFLEKEYRCTKKKGFEFAGLGCALGSSEAESVLSGIEHYCSLKDDLSEYDDSDLVYYYSNDGVAPF